MRKIQTILFTLGFMVSMNAFADIETKNLDGVVHALAPHKMICFSMWQTDNMQELPHTKIIWWQNQNTPYNYIINTIVDKTHFDQYPYSGIYGGKVKRKNSFPADNDFSGQYSETACYYNVSLVSTLYVQGMPPQ